MEITYMKYEIHIKSQAIKKKDEHVSTFISNLFKLCLFLSSLELLLLLL